MALPPAIKTAQLSFGPMLDDAGYPYTGTVTIASSRPKVWAATGTPIMPRPVTYTLDSNGMGITEPMPVDQSGFTDGQGNAVTNWTYSITIDLPNRTPDNRSVYLPETAAGTVQDLDLLSVVPSSQGILITLPAVSSVNAKTGGVVLNAADVGALDTASAQSTFNPALGPLRNRNLCAVGDSITDYDRNVGVEPLSTFNDWPARLADLSNGALVLQANVAVGGRQTSHILAGFDAELAGTDPSVILDLSGTNDARAGIPLSTFITNKLAILNKIRAKGALPVWVTIPPSGVVAIGTPAAPTLTTATTGGTLAPGTYSYRVTATRPGGESLPSAAATIVVPAGTSTNVVNLVAPAVQGANGYKFYGRTSGSELRLATATVSTQWNNQPSSRTFQDTGSVTPSGAVPSADATGVAADTTAGPLVAPYNAWMRNYAAQNGIVLIPFWEDTVDYATGLYQVDASRDGIHPSPNYSHRLAAMGWDALKARTMQGMKRTVATAVESTSWGVNPVFVSNVNGWTVLSASSSTFVREARTGFAGFAAHYTGTKAPSTSTTSYGVQLATGTSNSHWTAGDILEFAMKLEIVANDGASVIVTLVDGSNSATLARWLFNGITTPQIELVKRVPAPTGNFIVGVRNWYGTAEWFQGELSVRNLTAMGLA